MDGSEVFFDQSSFSARFTGLRKYLWKGSWPGQQGGSLFVRRSEEYVIKIANQTHATCLAYSYICQSEAGSGIRFAACFLLPPNEGETAEKFKL